VSAEGSNKAIIAALSANLGLGVTKFGAFALTGASSMLAEAIHSVADSGNQALLLVGGRQAKKEEDTQHPFGYSRARYYYAFLVAVVLFTLGGLFALYESWQKFQHPEPIESWKWVPIVVLLGLVFALLGVSMTLITHDGLWDAAGTGMIGLLLCIIAFVLARETKSMLMGESATPEDVRAIRAALEASDLGDVIHLRTMHLGPDDVLVAAKVGVPAEMTAHDVGLLMDDAEARIRAAVPAARLIYLEPDVRRAVLADTPHSA